MTTENVIEGIVAKTKCPSRIKLKGANSPSDWASWFIVPTPGYVELSSCGPVSLRDIEWIEINPVIMIHMGRLIKAKQVDYKEEIGVILSSASIPFELITNCIRVVFNKE